MDLLRYHTSINITKFSNTRFIVHTYKHHFCSGHQKEANGKDCLLIIDHVTGEITLEKLSSQIMVKKTRAEKPDLKNPSQDSSINITPSNSRPHTPINSAKHEAGKSGISKKAGGGNKLAGTKFGSLSE